MMIDVIVRQRPVRVMPFFPNAARTGVLVDARVETSASGRIVDIGPWLPLR